MTDRAGHDRAARGRPGLLPTLVVALAGSGLAAFASARTWVRADQAALTPMDPAISGGGGQVPLATAFSLVLLALWGVVLVTGRRVRRVLIGAALLAALAVVAAGVWGIRTLPDQVSERAEAYGADGGVTTSGWVYVAIGAALVAALAAVAGWRGVAGWPVMGRRYDAPGARRPAATAAATPGPAGAGAGLAEEGDPNLGIWQRIDAGDDPTTDPPADPTTHPTTHPTRDPAAGDHPATGPDPRPRDP